MRPDHLTRACGRSNADFDAAVRLSALLRRHNLRAIGHVAPDAYQPGRAARRHSPLRSRYQGDKQQEAIMTKKIITAVFAALLMAAGASRADWHSGTVRDIYYSYDGSLATFTLVGFSKAGCTCYSPWSDRMCLNRTRTTYKEEMATLLTAKATGQTIQANIDEATCSVIAFGVQ
jgi:hypothetical protein